MKNSDDFRGMEVGTGQRARIGGNILLSWDVNNRVIQNLNTNKSEREGTGKEKERGREHKT